jgi:hypothetical protein
MKVIEQTASNLYVIEATIAIGESASEAINTGGATPVSVFTPSAVEATTVAVKLQSAVAVGDTFVDSVNSSGGVIKAPFTASLHAQFADAVNAPFIKLVAVSSADAAVAQATAARTFRLVLRKYLS